MSNQRPPGNGSTKASATSVHRHQAVSTGGLMGNPPSREYKHNKQIQTRHSGILLFKLTKYKQQTNVMMAKCYFNQKNIVSSSYQKDQQGKP